MDNKQRVLRSLAEHGYNVGFGAKKHFATYDIVEKVPGSFAVISLLIGVLQIWKPGFKYNGAVSVLLIFLSVIVLSINLYNSDKARYMKIGTELTKLYNQLRSLYYRVQSSTSENFVQEENEMNEIINKYYEYNITKQILGADWYAHYKFFAQMQHEWIHEQKNFTWRDKVPLSLCIWVGVTIIVTVVVLVRLFH